MSDGDDYLRRLLHKYAVPTGPYSPAEQARRVVAPVLSSWAGPDLLAVTPSGSYAKGNAVLGSADTDLFISLSSTRTLNNLYTGLFAKALLEGWSPRKQNVSVGVNVGGAKVDLVPGRLHPGSSSDHSLYRSKQDTWTKTCPRT
jgi:hypothetical protein